MHTKSAQNPIQILALAPNATNALVFEAVKIAKEIMLVSEAKTIPKIARI